MERRSLVTGIRREAFRSERFLGGGHPDLSGVMENCCLWLECRLYMCVHIWQNALSCTSKICVFHYRQILLQFLKSYYFFNFWQKNKWINNQPQRNGLGSLILHLLTCAYLVPETVSFTDSLAAKYKSPQGMLLPANSMAKGCAGETLDSCITSLSLFSHLHSGQYSAFHRTLGSTWHRPSLRPGAGHMAQEVLQVFNCF